MRLLASTLLTILSLAAVAQAEGVTTLEGELGSKRRWMLWAPAEGEAIAPGRHPILLFSHGYLGAADQSASLCRALAEAGVIVAAVDHADAKGAGLLRDVGKPGFLEPKRWDASRYRDRRDDILALWSRLRERDAKTGDALAGHIDADKLGLMGHSLGGYTVLGLAGARPEWAAGEDEAFHPKALILLSPYVQPYFSGGELAAVKLPAMIQSGTADLTILPFTGRLKSGLGGSPRRWVVGGAYHFAWTELAWRDKAQAPIAAVITELCEAFCEEQLLGGEPRWPADDDPRLSEGGLGRRR